MNRMRKISATTLALSTEKLTLFQLNLKVNLNYQNNFIVEKKEAAINEA